MLDLPSHLEDLHALLADADAKRTAQAAHETRDLALPPEQIAALHRLVGSDGTAKVTINLPAIPKVTP